MPLENANASKKYLHIQQHIICSFATRSFGSKLISFNFSLGRLFNVTNWYLEVNDSLDSSLITNIASTHQSRFISCSDAKITSRERANNDINPTVTPISVSNLIVLEFKKGNDIIGNRHTSFA